jgi:hypothetical protein
MRQASVTKLLTKPILLTDLSRGELAKTLLNLRFADPRSATRLLSIDRGVRDCIVEALYFRSCCCARAGPN